MMAVMPKMFGAKPRSQRIEHSLAGLGIDSYIVRVAGIGYLEMFTEYDATCVDVPGFAAFAGGL